ncbi:MAG: transcriptional regulator [Patescibacteria group bacterium]
MDLLNEKGLFHQLMHIASRLENNANRYYFEPMGLSITYCRILCTLSGHKGTKPTEILQIIGGTKSNISQRLAVLEKRGFVKRQIEKSGDKRNVRVEMTDEGHKKYQEITSFMLKKSDYIEQQFTTDEMHHLKIIIGKLNKLMDSHEERLAKTI